MSLRMIINKLGYSSFQTFPQETEIANYVV